MIEIANEFRENNIPVFGLQPINKNGSCGCGDAKCEAQGKHPLTGSWQYAPIFSDEQFEFGCEVGQFDSGYGVLCKELIVIDVDARNGGVDSYTKLIESIPEILECGMIVETGSGGGSKHLFFKAPSGVALSQHLSNYIGIDFKSSGFVVGAGSNHKSGNKYRVVFGSPSDILDAPSALIDLLRVKEKHRSIANGETMDISDSQIIEMLSFIDFDSDYETWIKCGMAIHNATGGTGFSLWDNWSAKGKKYPSRDALLNRWHSFGKSSNPVSLGTLIFYAEQNGYVLQHSNEDVTFVSDVDWGDVPEVVKEENCKNSIIDLLRPPSFVGVLSKWINDASGHDRENLAVGAALMTVASCGGMRYYMEIDGRETVSNMFAFGIAGSATGKEDILSRMSEILRAVGLMGAIHSDIKSEQEIIKNLIDHQQAFYVADEMGEILAKIAGARKKAGSTPYLEGVIKAFMDIYSKSTSFKPVTGDVKRKMKNDLQNELKSLRDKIKNNEADQLEKNRCEILPSLIETSDNGLERPFLHIFGLSTPEKFAALVDFEMVTSGFLGRSFVITEHNNNPRRKKIIKDIEVFENIKNILSNLYLGGNSEKPTRISQNGERIKINVTDQARKIMDKAYEHFYSMAEHQEESKGMTAVPRRGSELMAKICLTLAIPSGTCTEDMALWAFEFVKRDIDNKIILASTNSTNKGDALIAKILSNITKVDGITSGKLINICSSYKKEAIDEALNFMIKNNMIIKEEYKNTKGRNVTKYLTL